MGMFSVRLDGLLYFFMINLRNLRKWGLNEKISTIETLSEKIEHAHVWKCKTYGANKRKLIFLPYVICRRSVFECMNSYSYLTSRSTRPKIENKYVVLLFPFFNLLFLNLHEYHNQELYFFLQTLGDSAARSLPSLPVPQGRCSSSRCTNIPPPFSESEKAIIFQ